MPLLTIVKAPLDKLATHSNFVAISPKGYISDSELERAGNMLVQQYVAKLGGYSEGLTYFTRMADSDYARLASGSSLETIDRIVELGNRPAGLNSGWERAERRAGDAAIPGIGEFKFVVVVCCNWQPGS